MTLTSGESQSSTNPENSPTGNRPGQVAEIRNVVEETPEQMLARAKELLLEGKRNFVCRNFEDAVDDFDEASELFSKIYGETAFECAEAYFGHGKSMLELERLTQSIIQVAKQGPCSSISSDSDESECEDDDEPEPAAPASETAPAEDKDQTPVPDDPKSEDQSKAAAENEQQEAPAAPSADEGAPIAPPGDEEPPALPPGDEEEQEYQPKTAVVWEILDLARVVNEKGLEKKEDKDERKVLFKRIAEIRVCLGEVCVLDEKYDNAIAEFQVAQKILAEHCPDEHRRLAEAYFHAGSASEYDGKFDVAKENFKKAIEILEAYLKKLETEDENDRQAAEKGSSDGEKGYNLKKREYEIGDMKTLLLDMNQRLADVVESEKEQQKAKADLAEMIQKLQPQVICGGQAGCGSASIIPADDVTHLVRKPQKRDSPSESTSPVVEPKRVKFEENSSSENGRITGSENPGAENDGQIGTPASEKGQECSPSKSPGEKNDVISPPVETTP